MYDKNNAFLMIGLFRLIEKIYSSSTYELNSYDFLEISKQILIGREGTYRDRMGALRMGQQRKKVKIHFIGCWKSRIISCTCFIQWLKLK
jgi:hypothetical protein